MADADVVSTSDTTQHGQSLARRRAARQLLAGGATVAVLGVLLSLGAETGLGGAAFMVGLVVTLLGVHRVGRLGPT